MQRLELDDKPKEVEFANTMLDCLSADPDLTPLNFFLLGYIKDKVYATPVRDLRDLRERIIEAIESIPEDMLQRAWQEIVCLDIVTVTAGAHVEIWPSNMVIIFKSLQIFQEYLLYYCLTQMVNIGLNLFSVGHVMIKNVTSRRSLSRTVSHASYRVIVIVLKKNMANRIFKF
ncbi:hypothetical protein ANN_21017 [Periplaneta americana]|uniref:Uncharacterized protein n=1 Tax=Periplaneta americana TaxID=6978 RepID=A0ABQ8SEM3_PERAM|nr:hypothetical protein ANN_21017 [Periplaneta americana]